MNRLDDQHIHLLLDDPIYVLADHGDHPTGSSEKEEQPVFQGENRKGICIFASGAKEEDKIFLFKGLNALNIDEADVAIFDADYESLKEYPAHNTRLRFTELVKLDEAFDVHKDNNLTSLNCIPLQEIRNSQDFKRKFWEALKSIFKV